MRTFIYGSGVTRSWQTQKMGPQHSRIAPSTPCPTQASPGLGWGVTGEKPLFLSTFPGRDPSVHFQSLQAEACAHVGFSGVDWLCQPSHRGQWSAMTRELKSSCCPPNLTGSPRRSQSGSCGADHLWIRGPLGLRGDSPLIPNSSEATVGFQDRKG